MNVEVTAERRERAQKHAALADPARLAVVDLLVAGDYAPSELGRRVGLSSNLLAHHLRVLEAAGLTRRRRSQGDGRRCYVTLSPEACEGLGPRPVDPVLGSDHRMVFVCTANSARSQLATSLWRQLSARPAASAGTHPAARVAAGATAAAKRHRLPLDQVLPQHLDDVLRPDDVVITVCDNAHEELGGLDALHWAIPDPVPTGTAAAFDLTIAELTRRITALAS